MVRKSAHLAYMIENCFAVCVFYTTLTQHGLRYTIHLMMFVFICLCSAGFSEPAVYN